MDTRRTGGSRPALRFDSATGLSGLFGILCVAGCGALSSEPVPHPTAASQAGVLAGASVPLGTRQADAGRSSRTLKDSAVSQSVRPDFGRLPLAFEANHGQAGPHVKFLARAKGYTLSLTSREAVLVLSVGPQEDVDIERPSRSDRTELSPAVLRMKLLGANPEAQVTGLAELPGKANYFIAADPANWRANVPTYARVEYQDLYPGIDLVYYGNGAALEHDFVLAPGADPGSIRLAFEGAEPLTLGPQGELVLRLAGGVEVRLEKPTVYQEVGGVRQEVSGRYVLHGEWVVGFQLAQYDPTQVLVIDPVLVFSTYLGGSGYDTGSAIALDAEDNVYVAQAASLTKLDPSGTSVLYSTRYGAPSSSIMGLAVDGDGYAFVTGWAGSGLPTVGAIQPSHGGNSDAFLAKLDPSGSALVYSTYLGGSDSDGGSDVAVDAEGNAYVVGYTKSDGFPTRHALQPRLKQEKLWLCIAPPICWPVWFAQDAFVTKVSADGTHLVYSTYLGGKGLDEANGIAVDTTGSAYVTGHASTGDFPTANAVQPAKAGDQDAFVAKLSPDGSRLQYSTYLGGARADSGTDIAVSHYGEAFVTGWTDSSDFPVSAVPFQGSPGGERDAFVAKLSFEGNALVYSTYLGGSDRDEAAAIDIDRYQNALVAGRTESLDFPTAYAVQPALARAADAVVARLNWDGSALVYSTYLGGGGSDYAKGIAVDQRANAYVTGSTDSEDFPVADPFMGLLQGRDAFVTKVAPQRLVAYLHLNQNVFTTGETLTIDFGVQNLEPSFATDVYFGALMPDGHTLVFVSDLSPPVFAATTFADTRTFSALYRALALPDGETISVDHTFSLTFSAAHTPGEYRAFLALVPPGTLDDGTLDDGDITRLSVQPFTLNP